LAGGRFAPGFGGARDHDVAGLGIAEDIFKPGEAGEVFHGLVDAAAFGDVLRHDALEARERNLTERALAGDVAIEPTDRLGHALTGELAGWIDVHYAVQNAVGVDSDAGRVAATDGVLREANLRGDQQDCSRKCRYGETLKWIDARKHRAGHGSASIERTVLQPRLSETRNSSLGETRQQYYGPVLPLFMLIRQSGQSKKTSVP
jgi:hypothetical protein